jgi:NAD(P)-dependent dehydrogenase (short-subunit alcohol dehydrogenase family)
MSEFQDKVVLVTGAGRGIGRAIAESFAKRGAVVAANDLTPINLDETVARIRSAGNRAREYIFDVAKKMPVQTMIEQILDDWGRIDILVNNAAVAPRASLLEMDEWDWRRTIDVNLSGCFFTLQSVARVMREQGGGTVVNIASTSDRSAGFKDAPAYVASKAGLIGLTRAAARELAPHGIRVNAVCPGVILPLESRISAEGDLGQQSLPQNLLADIPQQRAGRPEEVAQVVLFLSSSAAAYLTGQTINVDGGRAMG